MRRLLAAVCLLLLASCAEQGHHEPDAPAKVVRLVSQTGGGGRVANEATRVSDDAEVDRYVVGFERALADQLRAAIAASSRAGGTLYAQVVALGCDVPPGASVEAGKDVVIRPDPVASPRRECFAPVTTVALVLVPGAV